LLDALDVLGVHEALDLGKLARLLGLAHDCSGAKGARRGQRGRRDGDFDASLAKARSMCFLGVCGGGARMKVYLKELACCVIVEKGRGG